jgi:hypothetical protein
VRSATEGHLRLRPRRVRTSRRSSPRGLRAVTLVGVGQFRFAGFQSVGRGVFSR